MVFYTETVPAFTVARFFDRMDTFSNNSEEAISTIPKTDSQSGDSSARIIQLSNAPETGIRNFQILSSETFTDGLRSNVFQMEMAAADKKLNQPNAK